MPSRRLDRAPRRATATGRAPPAATAPGGAGPARRLGDLVARPLVVALEPGRLGAGGRHRPDVLDVARRPRPLARFVEQRPGAWITLPHAHAAQHDGGNEPRNRRVAPRAARRWRRRRPPARDPAPDSRGRARRGGASSRNRGRGFSCRRGRRRSAAGRGHSRVRSSATIGQVDVGPSGMLVHPVRKRELEAALELRAPREVAHLQLRPRRHCSRRAPPSRSGRAAPRSLGRAVPIRRRRGRPSASMCSCDMVL